jgi:hypothetical protein
MTNPRPTITADQLAAYVTLPPTQRLHVLERAKFSDFYPDPFAPARELGRQILVDGRRPGSFDGPGAQCLASIAAWRPPPTSRLEHVSERPVLEVSAVTITGASPDVLVLYQDGSIGGLALAFESISEQSARTRSALMAMALLDDPTVVEASRRQVLAPSVIVDPEDCMVLAAGTLHVGPKRLDVIGRDIERACDEIRRMWSTV